MGKFIFMRSTKFPILPGEEEEIVNEGMYGKALALYLQGKLRERGYDVPFVCSEDWGWWVDIKSAPFPLGVCVYADPREQPPVRFVCTDGGPGTRKWSWRKFRFIQTAPWVNPVRDDLLQILETDPEIEVLDVSEEFPDFD